MSLFGVRDIISLILTLLQAKINLNIVNSMQYNGLVQYGLFFSLSVTDILQWKKRKRKGNTSLFCWQKVVNISALEK